MRRLLTLLAPSAMLTAAAFGAQAPDGGVDATVERAGHYVTAYVDAFSAVVSEERQVQELRRADGRVKQTRQLTSDFLLIKTGEGWPLVFRDVIEVDGKPVRNREDRLRKLFLEHPKTAVEMARAVAKESQRHNLGLPRTGNSPLLPLVFLTPKVATGVRFALSGDTLTFEEFRSPSVLARRTPTGRIDLMSHGSFALEPRTGRVLAAEFETQGPPSSYAASFRVRYQTDAKLALDVPAEVTERYWRPSKPGDDTLEVRSTYSGFRRFDVKTNEQIKDPPR